MDLLCCVVVTGIGTSVSYHIASFGIALNKRQKTLIQETEFRLIFIKADFRVRRKTKHGEKVDYARNKRRKCINRLMQENEEISPLVCSPEGRLYVLCSRSRRALFTIYKEH